MMGCDENGMGVVVEDSMGNGCQTKLCELVLVLPQSDRDKRHLKVHVGFCSSEFFVL